MGLKVGDRVMVNARNRHSYKEHGVVVAVGGVLIEVQVKGRRLTFSDHQLVRVGSG